MTKKILIPTFFLIYLFIGLFIYNDYGIGIEEHFQRQNGFYWTVKIFSYLGVDSIKIHSLDIYQSIRSYDPNLPDSNFFNYYGITFDATLAFAETVFKMKLNLFIYRSKPRLKIHTLVLEVEDQDF